ncbi:hypothetical protein PUNSTDRAFT_137724 [Punctularia strigosozonata HHB-11173 SS5]|uniref:uncharacterized protein n=1 Tax=Punctularia strigosozonata (strain HHB-11173) TaxID=741275 RepID=UPI00044169A1|nr:uncharacterized protein PUNSTDRAFT_137724 [Punctularia strigosozonata HHB-11173 SS5]EIN05624.1 hypothetical protein PUNSTDRAFT_137724 [Punctularia strigosozonata HHB-11173 SS5]
MAAARPLVSSDTETVPITELFRGRNIVLCFDGTTNRFGKEGITNVIRVYELLNKDTKRQVSYYQAGIGTYDAKVPVGTDSDGLPLKTRISKWKDVLVANGIKGHILGGYRFLMNHWKSGDRIYMFGFSRGAYTARALCGMIEKVGLLIAGNDEHVEFAWKMYKMRSNWQQAGEFRDIFGQKATIHFLGLWDTVRSTGTKRTSYLPEPGMSPTKDGDHNRIDGFARYVYHALSLDERRVKFEPEKYHPPPPTSGGARPRKSTVIERWFVGDHSDIGGRFGFLERKSEEGSLANLSFRWIVWAAAMASADGNIIFSEKALRKYRSVLIYGDHGTSTILNILTTSTPEEDSEKAHKPQDTKRPPREHTELADKIHCSFDHGLRGKGWAFLEIVERRPTRGRYRKLPAGAKLHASARSKVESDKNYALGHPDERDTKLSALEGDEYIEKVVLAAPPAPPVLVQASTNITAEAQLETNRSRGTAGASRTGTVLPRPKPGPLGTYVPLTDATFRWVKPLIRAMVWRG